MNDYFDKFVQKYQSSVQTNSPQTIEKVVVFNKQADAFVNGQQVVNGTRVHGLHQVERVGNVTAVQTGKNSWNVDGQVFLTAPKLTGDVYLFNGTKFVQKVNHVTFASTDSVFNFSSTIELKWNQLVINEFYYNGTSPDYFTTVTNCSVDWMVECAVLTQQVQVSVTAIAQELLTLLRGLFAAIPLK